VPVQATGHGSAYVKFPHPASRYAVVGAAAVVSLENGRCRTAAVAVGGLTPQARRVPSVEQAITNTPADAAAIAAAVATLGPDLGSDVVGDMFASADYRRAMAPVYASRALAAARDRAGAA
jgi:carbon-monoxide dehydrogenase medium subunit